MTENNEINAAPSKREIAAAAAMYPIAYIYTLLGSADCRIWFCVFTLLYVLLVEYMCRSVPVNLESRIWLGCIAVITLCVAIGWGRVWDYELSIIFVHPLAVWWTLSRSGSLLEGESGHLFPADVLNGLIRIPFGSFFLRSRCVKAAIANIRQPRDGNKSSVPAAALAIILGALLLYGVTVGLSAADSGFGSIMEGVLAFLTPRDTEPFIEFLLRFLVSLPIGAWLFGLVCGSRRTQRTELDTQAEGLRSRLTKLRAVPTGVWTVCAAVFSAVYLLFFVIQGSYLFGAFSRSLPEGFTVAQYARQGFFELCRVMALNFALLWLITRTGRKSAAVSTVTRVMCTLLLCCGMLLAVVAVSKLWLYISCFGFTPKRLQSTWLALLLLCGSGFALYSLWSRKKSFRAWLILAAVTLTLLHLY